MTVYVAEVKGKGIAAFHADDHSCAELRVRDRIFRDDLMALATGCVPLWDGISDILIRQAHADEEAQWRASHSRAIRQGNIAANDDEWVAFLVSLTDPDRRRR